MDKTGRMLVNFDAWGAGSVCTAKGVTLLSAMTDGSGFRTDPSGIVVARWNKNGEVAPPLLPATHAPAHLNRACVHCQVTPESVKGRQLEDGVDPAATRIQLRLSESLGVEYDIKSRRVRTWFTCSGITHCFEQGHNKPLTPGAAEINANGSIGLFGGPPPKKPKRKSPIKRRVGASPSASTSFSPSPATSNRKPTSSRPKATPKPKPKSKAKAKSKGGSPLFASGLGDPDDPTNADLDGDDISAGAAAALAHAKKLLGIRAAVAEL